MNRLLGVNSYNDNFILCQSEDLSIYTIEHNICFWNDELKKNSSIPKLVIMAELILWENFLFRSINLSEVTEDDCLELIKWWNGRYLYSTKFHHDLCKYQFDKWLGELHRLRVLRKKYDTRGKSILD